MKLSGHRVLVTGGSRGIGLEIARKFLALGNKVAICGRSEDALVKARLELGDVEVITCDLSESTASEDLALQVKDKLGGISILVNNAGIQKNYSFLDGDVKRVSRDVLMEMQINLLSVMQLTTFCFPMLRASEGAAVINVSSGLAITPKESAPVYCASKAGLHSFSQSLRYQCESAGSSIKVFEVMPPLVETDMTLGRGANKLSPRRVADEIFRALERDKYEICIHKVKLLNIIHRLSPALSARILRKS